MTDSTTEAPAPEARSETEPDGPPPPSPSHGPTHSGSGPDGPPPAHSGSEPAGRTPTHSGSELAGPTPPVGGGEPDRDEILRAVAQASGRRRWPWLVVGVGIGAAAAVVTSAVLTDRGADETGAVEQIELATAEVERRDLTEEIEWSGTLGYGEPVSVTGSGGVVTAAASVGDPIDRGDVVISIDARPVVALFGSIPMWRPLSEGTEGPDVRQLEANLATLGYDPDGTVDVDDTFTANTGAMVERWQEDLGAEVTGAVEPGDVIVVDGPSTVTSILDVGAPASGPLLGLAPRGAVVDVVAGLDGTMTGLAPIGSVIEVGDVVYRVDDVPVVAIEPFDAVGAVLLSETFTVLELEAALAAGGHDPDGEMTVDGVITDATVAAVERWQAVAGLPATGAVDPANYVPIDPGHAVSRHRVADGDLVVTGGPIMATSMLLLSVSLTVDVADADGFELGQDVGIELSDETEVAGVVTGIGAVETGADPQASPTVDITVGITFDIAAGDDSPIEGPVTVVSVGEEVPGATVVPTRALVALAEGGFAVERVGEVDGASGAGGGDTTLIAVELGAFDDGMVEIVSGDLIPGDRVVVPS